MNEKQTVTTYHYTLLQIDPATKAAEEMLFKSMKYLDINGLKIDPANYRAVYQGQISGVLPDLLEGLFTRFNPFHPRDYSGRSMTTSDIIPLRHNDQEVAYYCDDFGFMRIPDFNAKEVNMK